MLQNVAHKIVGLVWLISKVILLGELLFMKVNFVVIYSYSKHMYNIIVLINLILKALCSQITGLCSYEKIQFVYLGLGSQNLFQENCTCNRQIQWQVQNFKLFVIDALCIY